LRLELPAKNALLFRVMTNKAFTISLGLTRNGPKHGDFLNGLRTRAQKKIYGEKARYFIARIDACLKWKESV
jgi:hypothetical protein